MLAKIKQAFHHQGFKKYFFNTGWLMADKVLRLVVGLFVGVYVARYLGPDKFGILSFAMSFVALFGAFAKLGLNNIVVRNAVQDPDSRDELLGTAFGLRVLGGLFLLVFVFGAIQLTDSDPLTQLIVMIIAAGHVLQAFEVVEFYFHSQVLARLSAIAGVVGLLAASAVKLALIWSGASLIWFAWVFVFQHGIKGAVLLSLYIKQKIPLLKWRFKLSQAKLLLRDSWPLILSGLVVMVYMRIDQVMIKMMLDNKAVGNYAAAVRLSEAWYFVPMAITQSLFPAILNAKKQSEKLYYDRLQRLYDLMVWLAIAVALPTTFLSGWVVNLLYGQEYSQAGGVLALHIWAGIFVAMGVASSRWLLTENLQIISARNTALGAVINVVLNFILLPYIGIMGAAVATVISYGFAAYIALAFFSKTRPNFSCLTKSLNLIRSARSVIA
ncbi:MAG: flippase [Desulfovermiculus sp.]|nr:flippase [Desulfovermiculus sp.]